MSEYIDIEKDLYSQEKSAKVSTDEKDLEDYIDKVENHYHKARKEEWWKAYKINYKSRFGKKKEKQELD